jgi:hypothetical protein
MFNEIAKNSLIDKLDTVQHEVFDFVSIYNTSIEKNV